MADATWVDGQSIIAQTRSETTIEWAWDSGMAGYIPVMPYEGGAPEQSPVPLIMQYMDQFGGGLCS